MKLEKVYVIDCSFVEVDDLIGVIQRRLWQVDIVQ